MSPAGIVLRIEFLVIYLACAYHAWMVFVVPWREQFPDASMKSICVTLVQRFVERLGEAMQRRRGAIDIAIQEMMERFRLEQCRKCATFLSNFFGPVLLLFVILREIEPDSPPSKEKVATSYGFLSSVYVAALLVAFDWVRLTALRLDVIFVFIATGAIARVAMMTDDPQFFTEHVFRQLLQLSASVVYMDYRKAIPWQLAFATVNSWRYNYNSSAIRLHKEPQDAALYFACREVVVCGIVILGSAVVESWLEQGFRTQITSQNQKRAMLKLASYHCDAVFWLTSDLRLSGPAPQLANMLFLGNVRNSLDGRQFANYIASDPDRGRFCEFVALSTTASEPEGLPDLLHMDLRDSTGRTFAVEVLHCCFLDINSKMGHFIGMCERRENEQHPVQFQEVEPRVAVEEPPRRENPVGDRVNVRSASSASQSSGSSQVPHLMPIIPEHKVVEPVTMLIHVSTGDILGCTAEFISFTGPLVLKTSIMDMLVDSGPFLRWIQHETNDLRGGPDRESSPFDIELSLRTSRNNCKFVVQSKAYISKVREYVSVADMGLELFCDDEIFDMLCVLWIRSTEQERIDSQQNEERIANERQETIFDL